MKEGHAEYGEIFVALLLIVAVAAAGIFFLSGTKGDVGSAIVPLPNQTADTAAPGNASNPPSMTASFNSTGSTSNVTVNVTNETTSQLVDQGIARAMARFALDPEHTLYSTVSFPWAIQGNVTPDSIPIKQNDLRASEMLFDGKYLDSLRGFGLVVSTPSPEIAAPQIIGATAVFLANSTAIDSFSQSGNVFTIKYEPYPSGSQYIEKCKVVGDMDLVSMNGSAYKIYDFDCKDMYPVNP